MCKGRKGVKKEDGGLGGGAEEGAGRQVVRLGGRKAGRQAGRQGVFEEGTGAGKEEGRRGGSE